MTVQPLITAEQAHADFCPFLDTLYAYDKQKHQWFIDPQKVEAVNQQFQNMMTRLHRRLFLGAACCLIITTVSSDRTVRMLVNIALLVIARLAWIQGLPPCLPEADRELVNIFRRAAHACRRAWEEESKILCRLINHEEDASGTFVLSDKEIGRFSSGCFYSLPKSISMESAASREEPWHLGITLLNTHINGLFSSSTLDSIFRKELDCVMQEVRRLTIGRIPPPPSYVDCTLGETIEGINSVLITSAKPWPAELLPPIL